MPAPIPHGQNLLEWYPEDVPEEGDAHAEIRIRRVGKPFNKNWNKKKIKGEVLRMGLRIALAEAMTVVVDP